MPINPVVIFGAGATKACGGPLTNEILPNIFTHQDDIEREGFIELLNKFLNESFHVPSDVDLRQPDHYPGLPLLLSLIDDPPMPSWRFRGTRAPGHKDAPRFLANANSSNISRGLMTPERPPPAGNHF